MSYTLGIYFSLRHCHAVFMQLVNHQYHYQGHLKIDIDSQCEKTKSQALTQCHETFAHPKRIIVGLQQQGILIQKITVDAVLTDAEIMQYLTQQTNTTHLDYETFSKTQTTKTLRVVTAKQSLITTYQNLFVSVHMPLHVIDVDILALERLSRHLRRLLPSAETNHFIKNLPTQQGIPFFISVGLSLWGCDR